MLYVVISQSGNKKAESLIPLNQSPINLCIGSRLVGSFQDRVDLFAEMVLAPRLRGSETKGHINEMETYKFPCISAFR
jgi:hypothetical protein